MSTENHDGPLLLSQRVIQICLFLFAFIALLGGAFQFYSGEPEVNARLDNVHRFMAGIYFGCGTICAWAGWTVRKQKTLILLIAFTVFTAGMGRVLSMSKVGIPEPQSVWLGYLIPELTLPIIVVLAYWNTQNKLK